MARSLILVTAAASAALAALLAAGCGSGLPPGVADLGYVNRTDRFAMNVPAGWTVRESSGLAAVIVSAPGPDEDGRPNVAVVIEPAAYGLTLDDLVRDGRRQLETLRGFRLLGEQAGALEGGEKAVTLSFEQSALDRTVRQEQMYVLAGGRAYIVTATATPEAFPQEQADFDTVFRSFRAGW